MTTTDTILHVGTENFDQEVLQSMITHEASFVSWIEKETAGDEGSLDAFISQLKYPLPAP